MAKILYKLGSLIAKHKWWAIVAWVVMLVAIITPMAFNSPKFDNDIKMTGLKSIDTNKKIEKHFNIDSEKATIRIVMKANSKEGIMKENVMSDVQKTLDDIKKDDKHVDKISNPYKNKQISEDKSTLFTDIQYDFSMTSIDDKNINKVKDHLDDLKDKHNIQTELTGNGMSGSVDVGGTSEIIGIIVAFIVLLITFGSFVAAGLPIISAILGLVTSVGIIGFMTHFMDVPNVTLTLAVMIGLAVGIDYALFILFRYRQIIKTERNVPKAVGLALGTAGGAVIFAGLTVIIAVCGLGLVGIKFLGVMGYMSAISVLFAVFSALTLVPALISLFHKYIRPKIERDAPKTADTGWSKFIVGSPLAAVLIGLILLVTLSVPVSHMRLGIPDDGVKPEHTTQKKAYDIMSDKFGEGFNGQIPMIINVKDKKDDPEAMQKDLKQLVGDINDMKYVDLVSPPQMSENKDFALVTIIPDKGPQAESTNDLVKDLREYNDDAKDKYGFLTEISGTNVINIDMSKKLNDAIPVFAGIIVALAFFLLMLVFRSIIIPLKAVLGFILSLTATLGFTTLIMQDGFMKDLFGIHETAPVLAFLPVIVIGILFGLAMDYEVFLMSRVHEAYSKTRDNKHAVKVGIKESGPVIIAAALIMFSVFLAFVTQDDVMIKTMGIALAFGVLFDAFVVRLMIIPALTVLFGKASWYLPAWLNRILPKFDIEGHALSSMMPEEEYISDSEQARRRRRYSIVYEESKQTRELYQNLRNQQETTEPIIYNALILYAKTHYPDIYKRFNSHETTSNNQDVAKNNQVKSPQTTSAPRMEQQQSNDEEVLYELLKSQNKNISDMNALIHQLIQKNI
ncbi:MMPL family transporter [Staphylococcus simulans]|uniref:MMPL family transporter n=3 Tax=Staphylococcus TaxID=1279 RepID=UPI001A908841|nr:MMPL family transporter [Staphylococcus simulans]MBO0386176.1 MMPL family transporter [Staphylococcus simulans]